MATLNQAERDALIAEGEAFNFTKARGAQPVWIADLVRRLTSALSASRPVGEVEIARIIALAGLGTTTGRDRQTPPNDKWSQGEWERRILEVSPTEVEQRCIATARAILALTDGALASTANASTGHDMPVNPSFESGEAGWREIETAPRDGTGVLLWTAHGRVLTGSWRADEFDTDDGPCGGWVADEEGQHPLCWTDGVCWSSNADEEPSDQPVLWSPRP